MNREKVRGEGLLAEPLLMRDSDLVHHKLDLQISEVVLPHRLTVS